MISKAELFKKNDRFFIYDPEVMTKRIGYFQNVFKAFFAEFTLAYSVKTNYLPCVLSTVIQGKVIPEIVSEFELDIIDYVKYNGSFILNGPLKTQRAIKHCIRNGGIINLDSIDDWQMVKKVILNPDCQIQSRLCIRLNVSEENLSQSRFGINPYCQDFHEIVADIKRIDQCKLCGFHLHLPDRDLLSFGRRANVLKVFLDSFGLDSFDECIIVNIGGGFRSKMPSSLANLNVEIEDYATVIAETFGPDLCKKMHLIIEPGTSLVAECFNYYAKIMLMKQYEHYQNIFVNGSILDYSARAQSQDFDFSIIRNSDVMKKQLLSNFVGYTCIEDDVLLSNKSIAADVGDFLEIKGVGSYSMVMRPNFIFPTPPVFVKAGGSSFIQVSNEQTTNDLFVNWKV